MATLGATLLCGACGSTPAPDNTGSDDFTRLMEAELAKAASGGASEAQLAILRAAQEAGALEFEPYKQAVDATLECFAEHDLRYENLGTDDSQGLPQISYVVEGPGSGPSAQAVACENLHSAFIADLYLNQPAAQEAKQARFEAAMPVLVPCLRDQGWLTATQPTADEVRDAIWTGFDAIAEGSATNDRDPSTCLSEAGVTSMS